MPHAPAMSLELLSTPLVKAPWRVHLLLMLWLVGGLLDSVTTAVMTGNGFTEGNAVAAWGMNAIGLIPYCTAAFLVCALFAGLGAACTRSLYGNTVVHTLLVLGAVKSYVALNNLWILQGNLALPGLG